MNIGLSLPIYEESENLEYKTFKNILSCIISIPPCLKFKGFLNKNFDLKFLKEQ